MFFFVVNFEETSSGFQMVHLGPHLGHLGPHLGYLGPHLAHLGPHLGHLGHHLGHLEPAKLGRKGSQGTKMETNRKPHGPHNVRGGGPQ